MDQFSLAANVSVLKRWARLVEDAPLPESFQSFRDKFPSDALRIEREDPQLVSLLSGQAPAALMAEVLSGNWPETAPTAEERAEAAKKARLQELYDSKPFGGKDANGNPIEPSITAQLELASLSPEIAKRSKDEAINVFKPERQDIADAVRLAEIAAEKKAISESHEFGQQLARRQYPVVRAAQIRSEIRENQRQARINSRNVK